MFVKMLVNIYWMFLVVLFNFILRNINVVLIMLNVIGYLLVLRIVAWPDPEPHRVGGVSFATGWDSSGAWHLENSGIFF